MMKMGLQCLSLTLGMLVAAATAAQSDNHDVSSATREAASETITSERDGDESESAVSRVRDALDGVPDDGRDDLRNEHGNEHGDHQDSDQENDQDAEVSADRGTDLAAADDLPASDRVDPNQRQHDATESVQAAGDDWGEWEQAEVAIQDSPDRNQNQEFGVGIQGEDELLLNRLDESVITRVSGALLTPDP